MIGLCGCRARPSVFDGGERARPSVFDGGERGSAGGSGPLQPTHNARHHLHPGCLGFLFLLYWPDFFPSSSRCAGRLSVEDVGAACEGGDRMGDPGPNFARRLPLDANWGWPRRRQFVRNSFYFWSQRGLVSCTGGLALPRFRKLSCHENLRRPCENLRRIATVFRDRFGFEFRTQDTTCQI